MYSFDYSSYYRMYKFRGIRLPITYFFENHLFDLMRGTDTHKWLPKESYQTQAKNFEHGVLYMSSWQSVICETFHVVKDYLQDRIGDYHFIDVGCGKGKVLISWTELAQKCGISISMTGIEYYRPLAEIAEANYIKCFRTKPDIIVSDIVEIDFERFGDCVVCYLYNPFEKVILEQFLDKIADKNAVVIYNNPAFEQSFILRGYEEIYKKKSWHQNGDVTIYSSGHH